MKNSEKSKPFPKEVDVIVIGSGAAGFSAALTAAIGGLKVVLLEKAEVFGGTTAISGGAIWVPESRQAKELGLKDSRTQVLAYLEDLIGDDLQREMVEAYLDAAPKMLDLFEKHTHLKFTAREISPDYHHGLKGTVMGGRTMDTAFFDGRLLGKDFDKLRPPLSQFMALGGMMVHLKEVEDLYGFGRSLKATTKVLKMFTRYFIDRLKYARGTRLIYGNALIAAALKSAIELGIDLRSNSTVTALINEDGKVKGATVKHHNKELDIIARHGVILATGGAPHNAKFRETYLRSPATHYSVAPKTNNGAVLDMVVQIGGYIQENKDKANAFFVAVSFIEDANGEKIFYPHLLGDRLKPGSIAVNSQGARFTNESSSYYTFVQGMYNRGEGEETKPAYLIGDQKFLKKYGLGLANASSPPEKFIEKGYLIKGETIEELAEKLQIPASNLANTIKQVNVHAEKGHDPDFGKGSSEYNKYMGDKTHQPNPCIGKIETAPYYAIKLWPGDFGTNCGLAIDEAARVLKKDKTPIENLYACGNDTHNVMSGFYPGGGTTLGPALSFGYLAATDILKKKKKLQTV